MKPSSFIWQITNHDNRVIHSTSDPGTLPLMKRYLSAAIAAGDDWNLVEYKLTRVLEIDSSSDLLVVEAS